MIDYKVPAAAYWLLLYLYPKERRFHEIIKQFPKATAAKILPSLEEYKYIKRNISKGRPIQVTYVITEKGKDFVTEKMEDVLKDIVLLIGRLSKINPQVISQFTKGSYLSATDENFSMPSEEIRLLLAKIVAGNQN
jgi:DNA-binding PadR family transcriptional regulator